MCDRSLCIAAVRCIAEFRYSFRHVRDSFSDRMIEKREAEIAAAKKQIEELQNISEVIRSRQSKLKHDISLIAFG